MVNWCNRQSGFHEKKYRRKKFQKNCESVRKGFRSGPQTGQVCAYTLILLGHAVWIHADCCLAVSWWSKQMWKLLTQSDLLAWKMWSQPCGWSLFFLAQTIVTFLQFYWSEPQNSLSFTQYPSWMSPKTSPESIWILFMCFEFFFFLYLYWLSLKFNLWMQQETVSWSTPDPIHWFKL